MKDYVYRLAEMVEAIGESKKNLESVIHQQEDLIALVEGSADADKFVDFIAESKEQLDGLKEGLDGLSAREKEVDFAVELANKSEENKEVANAIIVALGIFHNEDDEDVEAK